MNDRKISSFINIVLIVSSFEILYSQPNKSDSFADSTANLPVILVDYGSESIGQFTAAQIGANNPMSMITERVSYDTIHYFPKKFNETLQTIGLRSLRYPGGNGSGSYFWMNGLGPFSKRLPGFNGSGGNHQPDYYQFGFMEFMQFIKDIGASDPIICINFGLDSAASASAWVEFANAEVGIDPNGDGIDHAQLRADFGHPDPYHIRFWEIGNELGEPYTHMFSWHFGQTINEGVDYTETVRNYIFGGQQWQYQDLKNSEQGQRLVQENDWSLSACISTGEPDQIFFIKYPPVEAHSLHLAVCNNDLWGEEWTCVDSLHHFGTDDHVFLLDSTTGQISFGDGIHGAVPPEGKSIRAIYNSIDNEGLIDFYSKMKQADQTICIGIPFPDTVFYKEIAAAQLDELPFDFVVDHPYEGGRDLNLETEHWRMQWAARHQTSILNTHRQNLDLFFPQKTIGIIISEYNYVTSGDEREGTSSNPWYQGNQLDFFGRSLSQGLFIAGALISYLKCAQQTELWALHIHSIVPDTDEYIAGWGCTPLIGPEPFDYINPSGHVYSLFSQCYGHQLIVPELTNNPVYQAIIPDTTGRSNTPMDLDTVPLPCLRTIATRNTDRDSLILFILNSTSGLPEAGESESDISTAIVFKHCDDFKELTSFEFNGDSLWAVNASYNPRRVFVEQVEKQPFADSVQYTFHAHSLTMLVATKNTSTTEKSNNRVGAVSNYLLYQNYPNPFNLTTTIRYTIPQNGHHRSNHIQLTVYDIQGRSIVTLVNKKVTPGQHTIEFSAQNLSSGIYLVQLATSGISLIRKIVLIK